MQLQTCKACIITFLLLLSLMGCEITTSEVVKGGEASSSDDSPLKGAIVKNDIDVEATGVKVSAVYLMTANNQFKETNTAAANEKIILTIELDTGWTKINGKSFIGASEQIIGKDGKIILDAADLFKEFDDEGLSTDVANIINLTAVIDNYEPGYESFTVKYRVWDKKGDGEVKGSYKFKIE